MPSKLRFLLPFALTVLLALVSAQNVFAATLDQSQEIGLSSWTIWAFSDTIVGQEFKPSLPTLVAVEVKIKTVNPGSGADTITLTIRQGTINGAVLATATQTLADGFDGGSGAWVSFTLTPLLVTAGSTYVIRLQATKVTFGWMYQGSSNPYPDGRAIMSMAPHVNEDFTFRTYGSTGGSSVGGVMQPANTLTIFTPYLALIGLVGAAAVAVKKRRN